MTTNKNKNNQARYRIRPGAFKELGFFMLWMAGMTAGAYLITGSCGAAMMAFIMTILLLCLRAANGPVLFEPRRVEKPATRTTGA